MLINSESFASVAKEYLENKESIIQDGLNGYIQ